MIYGVGDRSEIRKHGADLVKDYHKSLVFNLLRTVGPISRADLARLTKMTRDEYRADRSRADDGRSRL